MKGKVRFAVRNPSFRTYDNRVENTSFSTARSSSRRGESKESGIDKAARERVKHASRELLAAVKARLAELDRFWVKEQTKGEVETRILDHVYANLPSPPYSDAEKDLIAKNVYSHVWQQERSGGFENRVLADGSYTE